MNDAPKTSVQELWQQQPVEGIRMSIDEIRNRATKFEKRLFWRNAREYISGGIAIILFGYFFAQAHDALSRIAFATLMAGMTYVLVYLHRKGGGTSAAAAQTGKQCVDFFLTELERQRELTSSLWWYLGPLVPGMIMLTVASLLHPRAPQSRWVMVATDVLFVALSYVIIRLNSRAARCLQKQIDELRSAKIQQG